MSEEFITNDALATKKIGYEFAQKLTAGDIICLYGDLGSGKTTFTQGLAQGLGLSQRIISPTFIIVRKYNIGYSSSEAQAKSRSHPGEATTSIGSQKKDSIGRQGDLQNDKIICFYHIDLYRTETEKELEGIGLGEILQDKNAVVVIEWAEKLGALLPEKRIEIKLGQNADESHTLRIDSYGTSN